MNILQKWIGLTLALTLAFSSVRGQQVCCQGDDTYSPAYEQSCDTTHWSVYIPIAALVGAAIWFGLADGYDNNESSNNSQDALGSIANPKRIDKHHSSRRYGKSSYQYKSSHSH
jgi:hypothetical protein